MKYVEIETGSNYISSVRQDELRCDKCDKPVLRFNHETTNKGYEILDEWTSILCSDCRGD